MVNKILIVSNAQNDFVTGSMAVPGARDAVNTIARILGKFDAIIYTQDWHHRHHCSFDTQGGTKPQHCVANSTGAQIIQYLPMQLGDIPIKTVRKGRHRYCDNYSDFWDNNNEYETELRGVLSNMSTDAEMKLYICGFLTEGCVRNTVHDAIRNYPNVVVIEDACRGREETSVDRAMEQMSAEGAMLLPSTCIVDHTPAAALIT